MSEVIDFSERRQARDKKFGISKRLTMLQVGMTMEAKESLYHVPGYEKPEEVLLDGASIFVAILHAAQAQGLIGINTRIDVTVTNEDVADADPARLMIFPFRQRSDQA